MRGSSLTHRLGRRVAGTVAATGLALAGLAVAASPANAAACSGTSGVTVVVDTGGSISTRCASGDPSTAWKALTAAGFGTTPVQTFPGALCQINGYPDTSCVRMPPASAYWAFFHAKAGGSWTYSSSGVASFNPAPGTVVGFRFGSGGQPGIAPPAPPATTPKPKPTTPKPKPTTAKPKPTSKPATSKPAAAQPGTSTSGSTAATGSAQAPAGATKAPATPTASAKASASATPSPTASGSSSASSSADGTPGAESSATSLAVAPTSGTGDGSSGLGTLLVGGALVALVAGGAGWAAWRRRV